MTRQEIKIKTKEEIKGKIGTFFLGVLLIGIISAAITKISEINIIISILGTLISIVLNFGLISMFLKCSRNEEVEIGNVFEGFKDFVRISFTLYLQTIYLALWLMLFLIPGLIKMYSYALTSYILIDNPELSYNAAITKSRQMMNGHKWELFILDLSFIGWGILTMITFGLASIYTYPYMGTARANFYNNLQNEI